MTDDDTTEVRERTPYQPDNQSLRVLLGALGVGAVVGVGVLLAVLLL